MKKLLLLAAAALTIVACKKDNDETPPGPCIEPASPYTVGFDYPKTIVSEENGSTSTITYTVTDLLLRTVTLQNTQKGLKTFTFTYDNNKYLTEVKEEKAGTVPTILKLSYNKKKQVERTLMSQYGGVFTSTFSYDTDDRVAKLVFEGAGTVATTQYEYVNNTVIATKVEVRDNGGGTFTNTNTYTFDDNGNLLEDKSLGWTATYTYTTGLNYNAHPAFKIIAPEVGSISPVEMSINYDRRFRYVAQKNFPNKAGVAEYGYNNVNKPTQIVIKSVAGTATQTLTY